MDQQEKPSLPILVGGSDERKILKIVAKHADVYNLLDPLK
jgi:hypothetical protein